MTQRTALFDNKNPGACRSGFLTAALPAVLLLGFCCVTIGVAGGEREAYAAEPRAERESEALDEVAPAAQQQFDTPQALDQAYHEGERLEAARRYFSAAATFFNVYTVEGRYQMAALGKLTENLIRAGLPNAASYFFIKTLQSENREAIRAVVRHLPALLDSVGGDLLRNYVLKHTREPDYDADTKNHFFYFLGKDQLLKGEPGAALQSLSKVGSGSGILAQAQYLRGTALAILGQTPAATAAFESCRKIAAKAEGRTKQARREQEDLESRCLAGLARSHYEARQYDKAEEIYDEIPKSSFVWTDILFEQAWNAFAKGDHNRALGKLVTYRSPSLAFVFNPEVDVLRAQAFLSLCLYDDVNRSVNEFNATYSGVGGQMKSFLLQNEKNLPAFHALAKRAFFARLHTPDMMNRALNRFIRGPYYASLIAQERATAREEKRIRGYYPRATEFQGGFGGFVGKVLAWRKKSISLLGGLYVKNSLYDLYRELLADFDKMSFVKLDMLGKAKARLERKAVMSEDEEGVLKKGKASVDRRDYQYFFTFNGEFWSDELGDYVFALESECGQ